MYGPGERKACAKTSHNIGIWISLSPVGHPDSDPLHSLDFHLKIWH